MIVLMADSKMDLTQLAGRIAATPDDDETHDSATSKIEGEGSLTMRCQWDGGGDPSLACTHEYKTISGVSKYCPCAHWKRCALPGCEKLILANARRITCCSAHKNALAALNHEHQETCQWPGCEKTFIVKSPGAKYCDGPPLPICAVKPLALAMGI